MVAAAEAAPLADFVLLGPESEYKAVVAKAASTSKIGNVHILPFVPIDELWKLTCSATAGIVLTQPLCRSYDLSEPNKLFEYMMAGIPIIASRIEGHCRLERETGAMVLVSPYESGHIARTIVELLAEPAKMKLLGKRGRYWAERKYNAGHEMKKLQLAYAMLGGPAKRSRQTRSRVGFAQRP